MIYFPILLLMGTKKLPRPLTLVEDILKRKKEVQSLYLL